MENKIITSVIQVINTIDFMLNHLLGCQIAYRASNNSSNCQIKEGENRGWIVFI